MDGRKVKTMFADTHTEVGTDTWFGCRLAIYIRAGSSKKDNIPPSGFKKPSTLNQSTLSIST